MTKHSEKVNILQLSVICHGVYEAFTLLISAEACFYPDTCKEEEWDYLSFLSHVQGMLWKKMGIMKPPQSLGQQKHRGDELESTCLVALDLVSTNSIDIVSPITIFTLERDVKLLIKKTTSLVAKGKVKTI